MLTHVDTNVWLPKMNKSSRGRKRNEKCQFLKNFLFDYRKWKKVHILIVIIYFVLYVHGFIQNRYETRTTTVIFFFKRLMVFLFSNLALQ